MIANLKPYAAYKDSGLLWLTHVPEHWGRRRMKFLFQERAQKGFPEEPLLAATQTKGVVRKADYGKRTVTAMKDFQLLKLVEIGDFVISLRSFEGGIEFSHCRGIISPAYTVLTPARDACQSYFMRLFKSADFIRSLTLFVTGIREGQNIDYERMSRAYMPLPPVEEQVAIGRFLDWASGRLERTIRAKREVIALLNEQRQAIIDRAVTRGLDPTAPLKPSGIPWLGDIPKHWVVIRAKYLYAEIDERSQTGLEEQLSVSHITGVTPRSQKNITMFKAATYVGHKVCMPGDLVVNTMWAWMGALGTSAYMGVISPAYGVYRPIRSDFVVGEYLDGLLRSQPYASNIICRSTGLRASRLRLYPEEFFRLPLIQPPVEEQKLIVKTIREKTSDLRIAIGRLELEIQLMSEYRTRLVGDVVTGKLDVREAAARLSKDEMDAEGDPYGLAEEEDAESDELNELDS